MLIFVLSKTPHCGVEYVEMWPNFELRGALVPKRSNVQRQLTQTREASMRYACMPKIWCSLIPLYIVSENMGEFVTLP